MLVCISRHMYSILSCEWPQVSYHHVFLRSHVGVIVIFLFRVGRKSIQPDITGGWAQWSVINPTLYPSGANFPSRSIEFLKVTLISTTWSNLASPAGTYLGYIGQTEAGALHLSQELRVPSSMWCMKEHLPYCTVSQHRRVSAPSYTFHGSEISSDVVYLFWLPFKLYHFPKVYSCSFFCWSFIFKCIP